MGLFNAIFSNAKLGIQISNQVIKSVLKDRGLFVYPIVMALLSFVLLALIFAPLILGGALVLGPVFILFALLAYYFVLTYMSTYFLFAMYIAYKAFIQGKKISMMQALSSAGQYSAYIFRWAVFYTIVMTVVKLLESQLRGLLGMFIDILASIGLFLGMTFAPPIIFEDKVGPIEAVKRSSQFIINNIGKTFSGIIYFDIISFVIKIIGIIFIVSAILMGMYDLHLLDPVMMFLFKSTTVMLFGFTLIGPTNLVVVAAIFAMGIAIAIIGMLFNYVMLHIYYLVIYDYVKNGDIPKGMDESLIKASIKHSTGARGIVARGKPGSSQKQNIVGNLFQTGDSPDLKDFVK